MLITRKPSVLTAGMNGLPVVFCSQYAIIIDSSLTMYEVIATILSNVKHCG